MSSRIFVAALVCGVVVKAAWGQAYTYRSPSIKSLNGVHFQWALHDGWRLVTPAESAIYKASAMPFTLQKLDLKTRRMQQVQGLFLFQKVGVKVVSKGLSSYVPLWGTDRVLVVELPHVPTASSYWTKFLGGISFVQHIRRPAGLPKKKG